MKWRIPLCPKSKTQQHWGRVSDCARFNVAKALIDGQPDYMLYDREKIIGHWPTFEEAQKRAEEIQKNNSALGVG